MNRRSFLAGLLATTAAVPLAKVPTQWDIFTGLDVASGPDMTAVALYRGERLIHAASGHTFGASFDLSPGSITLGEIAQVYRILAAAPVPEGTVWYDEATDFTPEQWDYMLRLQREEATHANRLPDRRT